MAVFEPNEDQTLLMDSVAKFIERSYDDAARKSMGEAAFDPARWSAMAELGWLMLPFQEADGGMQAPEATGAGDVACLYEALGPGLVVEPVLSGSILAGGLIAASSGPARSAELLAEIASGATKVAAALHEPRARHDLAYCEATAIREGEGWRLDGVKTLALGAPVADRLVILARIEGQPGSGAAGLGLFLAPSDLAGLTLTPYRLRDDSFAADVSLAAATLPAEALLAGVGEAAEALALAVDQTRFAMAAELVGIAARLNRETATYAMTRTQFGAPIGAFQVLQHRMVDMAVSAETARSLVYRAAGLAARAWTDEARATARSAYAHASDAAFKIAKDAVQIHGGMGMTEDVPIGRLLRRAQTLGLAFPEA